MTFLSGLFGSDGTSQVRQGAAQAQHFLQRGIKRGIGALDTAQEQYTPEFRSAAGVFNPFVQNGTGLSDLYSNAVGANGQSGYDAALGAFHNGPGFQFGLDAANQNILRNQAATGALNSGDTLNSLGAEAQGRQNQEYHTWLDDLFRGSGQGLSAATGQADVLTGLGRQFADSGAKRADVYTGGNSALATNASNLGNQLGSAAAADRASRLQLLGSILGMGAQFAGSALA